MSSKLQQNRTKEQFKRLVEAIPYQNPSLYGLNADDMTEEELKLALNWAVFENKKLHERILYGHKSPASSY
jgi:hypothetical protein